MRKTLYVFLMYILLFTLTVYAQDAHKAKYIFLFIGDGMGIIHVNATEAYRAALEGKIGNKKLNFTQFPSVAVATTYAADRYITDSGAAGTALATGNKTAIETISMDASKRKKFKSIARMAKEKGMKVGIVTTVFMNDATPAVFYAHQSNRSMLKEISRELATSDFDFFGGGGLLKTKNASELLASNGYSYFENKRVLDDINKNHGKVYLACPVRDEAEACRYSIDQNSEDIPLKDITKKAIEVLDNPNGFFVMIEGGKIDWAAHVNDAGSVFGDVIAFDDAIAEALKFYQKHQEETLIVVTSDHETGGMSLGTASMEYDLALAKIKNQKISVYELDKMINEYKSKHTPDASKLSDVMPFVTMNFGLGDKKKGLELTSDDKVILNNAFYETINSKKKQKNKDSEVFSMEVSRMLDQKAGISWATFVHTGAPVLIFSKGNGADLFKGYIDNTDVPKNIIKAAGLNN